MVYGTVVTSAIAPIAVPVGLGVSVFLSEDYLPKMQMPLVLGGNFLAAIPSVVYGWEFFFDSHLDKIGTRTECLFRLVSIFSTPPSGPGVFPAGVILSL